MGAHDEINIFDSEASPVKSIHICVICLHVPKRARRAFFVVTDAGVDQHVELACAHYIGLHGECHQAAGRIKCHWLKHRAVLFQFFWFQVREEFEWIEAGQLLLNNAVNPPVAQIKCRCHRQLPPCSFNPSLHRRTH